MKRIHLFEIMDLDKWPGFLRRYETDYLATATEFLKLYEKSVDHLGQILKNTRTSSIVDLCSGNGAYMQYIQKLIAERHGFKPPVTVTDIAPDKKGHASPQDECSHITHVDHAVDARSIPAHLNGFRTLFAGLHHFKPADARAILKDAFDKRNGIAIFEHTSRSFTGIASILVAPLMVILLTPFIKPFSLKRLLFTYIIPLVPIAILWDGIISSLRTYSKSELQAMINQMNTPDYQWQINAYPVCGIMKSTCLFGYPATDKILPETSSLPKTRHIHGLLNQPVLDAAYSVSRRQQAT